MHPTNLKKQKILDKLDEYIANCERALKEPNPFGSAGAGIQLNGAKQAFEELKDFVEKTL